MVRPKLGAKPWKPHPQQIRVLQVLADGCSLAEGGRRLGVPRTIMANRLSSLYTRLGITVENTPGAWLSHTRRQRAIEICREHGWWPEGEDDD